MTLVAVVTPLLILAGLTGALFAAARHGSGVDVAVVDDNLVVRITGKDAVFAFSRGMTVPLSCIQGIAVAPRRNVPATGFRLPGTGIPGVLRAGSFGTGASRDFWLVRQAADVLVIELEPGQPYRRLVLELPDAHDACLQLRPMTGAYAGTFGR